MSGDQQPYSYAGGELELFATAHNWKRYWSSLIAPFVGGRVLEVGGGIGANARWLLSARVTEYTCLEPDPCLCARASNVAQWDASRRLRIRSGTLADIDPAERFETIVYVDVLEHIADDRMECARASAHLAAGGHLIVLAPAHPWLYTPFDEAIGHFRRYTRRSLRQVVPSDLRVQLLIYVDAAGLLASTANRLLLKSRSPSTAQIRFWDGVLVRFSRGLDPLLLRSVGKTVLGVWAASARGGSS